MSARTILLACMTAAGVFTTGGAFAQSYLQSGDLNSIRQSNQSVPSTQPGVSISPPAPRQESSGGISAQFNQGMAEGERQAQRQREASAASNMQMRNLTEPQRAPPGRYPGAPTENQGAIQFDGQGQSACKRDPVSGQVQCGSM
ncbi:hypothetical protein [Pandoraea pnomenusa]|uniref:hypothetical protein n=1 Tax=Pandoraea pnomenusa TaxID=93220 RepID=UPI003341B40F